MTNPEIRVEMRAWLGLEKPKGGPVSQGRTPQEATSAEAEKLPCAESETEIRLGSRTAEPLLPLPTAQVHQAKSTHPQRKTRGSL